MITETETAILARLKDGLGRMVMDVSSYGGQLDDVGKIARRLPAVWVTFGGITGTRRHDTARRRYLTQARFTVFVVSYNVHSEQAGRLGGTRPEDAGCYRIIRAVRRLLSNQDFGLRIEEMMPGQVKNLFSSTLEGKGLSAYACEFGTAWFEDGLETGHWPAPESESEPDYDFIRWKGRTEGALPWHESSRLSYNLPGTDAPVADDIIQNRVNDDDKHD